LQLLNSFQLRQQARQDVCRKLPSFSEQHGGQRDDDRVVLCSYLDPIGGKNAYFISLFYPTSGPLGNENVVLGAKVT
jgi:hypothetical protein